MRLANFPARDLKIRELKIADTSTRLSSSRVRVSKICSRVLKNAFCGAAKRNFELSFFEVREDDFLRLCEACEIF